jgi:hypothetical protein
MPIAIGWTLEGKIGPVLYDIFASKDAFSRELLLERGMSSDLVNAIPQGEAFSKLVSFTGENASALTEILYNSHNVGMVWYIMSIVGVLSAIGIYIYGRWILTLHKKD